MSWFSEWFNTPWYHILYSNRSESEAEDFIGNLTRKLDFSPQMKVCDLCCGKGRHSRTLHKLGMDVTGLDLSEASIEFANQTSSEHLRFFVHDMRDVFPEKFDAVLNLFTSFGYFEDPADNLKVLQSVKQMLTPDGWFVLDFLNTDKIVREMQPTAEIQRGEMVFNIEKKVENGFIRKDIRFEADGKSNHFTEFVKIIGFQEFMNLFSEAGFEIKHTFGDYSLNEYSTSDSLRLIICAKPI